MSIGGGLWRLKGLPDGLRDVTLRIQAHRPIVTIAPFGGIVIPTLRRAVSRTPKGAVLSGPTGVLLQMSDIKLIPNAPNEKNNDR